MEPSQQGEGPSSLTFGVLLFYTDIYFLNIDFSRDYNYLVNTVDFDQNSVQLEKILTVK